MSVDVPQHETTAAGAIDRVRCAVVTISDTRTRDDDRSGDAIVEVLGGAGHEVIGRVIVRDDASAIEETLRRYIRDNNVQAIITTGGTGISRRDNTIAVVRGLLSVELPGFGELFRMLSYEEVQAAAMLSQAVGGYVAASDDESGDTFVFALPGSVNAVRTGMEKLIAPQLKHLVWERQK